MVNKAFSPEQFSVDLEVTIRSCRRSDLADLEWFGLFTPIRELFADAFRRYELGEVMLFVAETNGFPAGQVWVDLVKQQSASIGVIWALRVLPPLQNLGIGTRLIAAAERLLRDLGYTTAELGVEKNNPNAKRLYERLAYRVVQDNIEKWDYTTPDGLPVHVVAEEWIMRKPLEPRQVA